jgi:hypothetical protein
MAIYWNIDIVDLVSMQPADAEGRTNLILVKDNQGTDRTSELPTCESYYIKIDNNFPTEMTIQEKEAVDVQRLSDFRKDKKLQILSEAERRITTEDLYNDGGPFMNLSQTERELKIVSALALLVKALKKSYLKDLSVEEETALNVLGLEFESAKQIKDIADTIITVEVNDPTNNTIQKLKDINVNDNTKWTE